MKNIWAYIIMLCSFISGYFLGLAYPDILSKNQNNVTEIQNFSLSEKMILGFVQGRYGNEKLTFKVLSLFVGDVGDSSSNVRVTYKLNDKGYEVFLWRNARGEIISTSKPSLTQ